MTIKMLKNRFFIILLFLILPFSLSAFGQSNASGQSDSLPVPMTNQTLRDITTSKTTSTSPNTIKTNNKAVTTKVATQPNNLADTKNQIQAKVTDIDNEIKAAKENVTEKNQSETQNSNQGHHDQVKTSTETKKVICPPVLQPVTVNWTSKNSNDVLTIYNGSSIKTYVVILVNGSNKSPGIFLTNCGKVKHITAGNSVICDTGDSANPVSFSSDSNTAASGIYAIKTSESSIKQGEV